MGHLKKGKSPEFAEKLRDERKKIEEGHIEPAIEAMCTLNKIGAEISVLEDVVALTDVTGFGLMGHLTEICEGSDISAIIDFDAIPLLPNTWKYLELGCVPGGTKNNFKSYGHKLAPMPEDKRHIVCDAQTSGGLLCVVRKSGVKDFLKLTSEAGLDLKPIGHTITKENYYVTVK